MSQQPTPNHPASRQHITSCRITLRTSSKRTTVYVFTNTRTKAALHASSQLHSAKSIPLAHDPHAQQAIIPQRPQRQPNRAFKTPNHRANSLTGTIISVSTHPTLHAKESDTHLRVIVVDLCASRPLTHGATGVPRPTTLAVLTYTRLCRRRGRSRGRNGSRGRSRGRNGSCGPSRGGRDTTSLAIPDLGAGNLVGGLGRRGGGVDINHNAGIGHLEDAGDGDEVVTAGGGGAGASDGELGALGVELGGVGLVKREDLVADEIVAGGKRSRDLGGPLERIQDDAVAPFALCEGAGEETSLNESENV